MALQQSTPDNCKTSAEQDSAHPIINSCIKGYRTNSGLFSNIGLGHCSGSKPKGWGGEVVSFPSSRASLCLYRHAQQVVSPFKSTLNQYMLTARVTFVYQLWSARTVNLSFFIWSLVSEISRKTLPAPAAQRTDFLNSQLGEEGFPISLQTILNTGAVIHITV